MGTRDTGRRRGGGDTRRCRLALPFPSFTPVSTATVVKLRFDSARRKAGRWDRPRRGFGGSAPEVAERVAPSCRCSGKVWKRAKIWRVLKMLKIR